MLARSRRFSRLATHSASSSCGTVDMKKIPIVLTTECQNASSPSSSR
ncbi:hypothetical protein [Actinomadura keratinilytica]